MQTIRRSVGLSAVGIRLNEVLLNFSPHHGQVSSGIGDGFLSLFLKAMVFARADSRKLSPFCPILFGVAACPTQSPISNGHRPRFSTSFSRSNSRAQINAAARPSWS